jgi:hypothetical protein
LQPAACQPLTKSTRYKRCAGKCAHELSNSGQALTADACDPIGLYFGTTSGELWASVDEGKRWRCIAQHLPEIYAVEAAEVE